MRKILLSLVITLALNTVYADASKGIAALASGDITLGVKELRKGVIQGEAESQLLLGSLYEHGANLFDLGAFPNEKKSTFSNVVLAYALYSLSVAQNLEDPQDLEDAKDAISKLKSVLTPKQLAEAQGIIKTWKIGTPFPTETKN